MAERNSGGSRIRAWGALGLLVAAVGLLLFVLDADPPAPPSHAARVAAGRFLFESNCAHCHREIRIEGRVRGWDEARAYETVGRLWKVNRAMPHFEFAEEDRRALAAYLVAVGSGAETVPR